MYEAAKQLQKASSDKIAVIIIGKLAGFRFDVQLHHKWIDWGNPSFYFEHDFEEFLRGQQKKYPEIFDVNELRSAISELNEVWILSLSEKFEIARQASHSFRPAQREMIENK